MNNPKSNTRNLVLQQLYYDSELLLIHKHDVLLTTEVFPVLLLIVTPATPVLLELRNVKVLLPPFFPTTLALLLGCLCSCRIIDLQLTLALAVQGNVTKEPSGGVEGEGVASLVWVDGYVPVHDCSRGEKNHLAWLELNDKLEVVQDQVAAMLVVELATNDDITRATVLVPVVSMVPAGTSPAPVGCNGMPGPVTLPSMKEFGVSLAEVVMAAFVFVELIRHPGME